MKTAKHTLSYLAAALLVAAATAIFATPLVAAPLVAVDADKPVAQKATDQQNAQDDGITVRDLMRRYFKDGNGQQLAQVLGWKDEAKQVIALDYTVLLWDADKKVETAVRDPDNHQFNLGDSIRVTIQPLTDAYIYIFHRGASGETEFLLPVDGEQPPLVKTGQTLALPEDGYLEFVDPAGEEELLVVAAKEKVADLDALKKVLNQKPEQDTPAESKQRKGLNVISKKMKQRNSKKFGKKIALSERGINMPGGQEVHNWLVIKEHAGGKNDANLAVVASSKSNKQLKMLVSIPLKSIKKK